jgi:leucyl aminopeptidase
VVVGLFADKTLSPSGRRWTPSSSGRLAALAVVATSPARPVAAPAAGPCRVASPRVLVIGLGERAKFAVPQYLKAVGDAVRALRDRPGENRLLTLAELPVKGRDAAGPCARP